MDFTYKILWKQFMNWTAVCTKRTICYSKALLALDKISNQILIIPYINEKRFNPLMASGCWFFHLFLVLCFYSLKGVEIKWLTSLNLQGAGFGRSCWNFRCIILFTLYCSRWWFLWSFIWTNIFLWWLQVSIFLLLFWLINKLHTPCRK